MMGICRYHSSTACAIPRETLALSQSL
uniref:Uncharacterized protein n=1 Tax=Arundo donax TaxID=35708 RepID=A0A0A9DXS4_ARUDO